MIKVWSTSRIAGQIIVLGIVTTLTWLTEASPIATTINDRANGVANWPDQTSTVLRMLRSDKTMKPDGDCQRINDLFKPECEWMMADPEIRQQVESALEAVRALGPFDKRGGMLLRTSKRGDDEDMMEEMDKRIPEESGDDDVDDDEPFRKSGVLLRSMKRAAKNGVLLRSSKRHLGAVLRGWPIQKKEEDKRGNGGLLLRTNKRASFFSPNASGRHILNASQILAKPRNIRGLFLRTSKRDPDY